MPRAVQLTHAREAVKVAEVALPALEEGEVLVEIEACALGQLDWNLLTLDAPPRLPLVPGHEAVGTVKGRRVLLTPLASWCGRCERCVAGEPRFCAEVKWRGMHVNGALGTQVIARESSLIEVPDQFSPGLAMVGGSMWTAVGAVRAVGAAARVAVFGVGGVGHLVVQVLRAAGVTVLADDVSPERVAVALALGAEKMSGGFDAAIVCTPSMQALQRAVRNVRAGGTVAFVGTSPAGRIDLPAADLSWRGVRLISGLLGARADLDEALRLIRTGVVKPQLEQITLEEVPSKLWELRDLGFSGRLVVLQT